MVDAKGLVARLDEAGLVALDTSPFIYHLEDVAPYSELTEALFLWITRSGGRAVTSTLTLLEILVGPYWAQDEARVNEFYARLTTFPIWSGFLPHSKSPTEPPVCEPPTG